MRSGFSIVPLRRIARVQNGGTPGPHESNWEGDVPWATPVDLGRVHGGYLQATERSITATGLQSGSTLASAGSVLISSRAPIGYAAIAGMDTAFNQGCKALTPLPGVSQPRFLKYAVESQMSTLQAAGRGSTFTEVSASDVASLPVPVTSLAKQDRIADYLDRETAEIDAFIQDQERFKKLLLEHQEATRSSVIRRAAERQGVPHVRLKFLADVTVGIVVNPSSWYVEEEGVPALRGLNVRPEEISTSELVQISQEGHIAHSKSRLEAGDVVVVRTGQAGAAAVIPEHLHDCNAIDLLIVKPGDTLSSDFLSMYINSDVARGVISAQSVGAIQAHFNVEALRNLPIPYLDLPQQLRLVATWKEESSAVELALRDVETSIQLAQERRSALISAAVSGQIDVTAQGVSAAEQLRDELEVHV